ncbi:hypothetical protein [Microscilla marina]|uniref:Uncharacterized protein n=1 Tax=Microscilla marina ATCC 23134 TaxID=313606 RepID=A1ZMZ0_MICM2|nr:hypothetical protein [Microscilla marina]EAY28171.1 hypothetical protein M23134_03432 [Microscilla marina ATCC 23134]
MQEFDTIEEAFRWFLENDFPNLSSEDKVKLKDVKYSFYKEGRSLSKKKMVNVMEKYGEFKTVYKYGSNKK